MKKESSKEAAVAMPELLAPAGSFEKLVTAIHYGADAVYLGGKKFSLRAKAGNFSDSGIGEAVRYSHDRGVMVYVTVNVIAHNDDLDELEPYLTMLRDKGVDGVIISDPGIMHMARQFVPELPIHLSTQANVTNHASASFWFSQGPVRLNLARELSLREIHDIRAKNEGELEVFVHGALCISYSGRCMLSSYMTGRDANQGNCAHPCRYSYKLIEEKRPGEFFPVEEDERGTYIFNAKDLCLFASLPELVAAGVDSLKIEGRMKSIFYVGGVVRVYRAALDYLKTLAPEVWEHPEKITFPAVFMEELEKTGTRGATENFLHGKPGEKDMIYTTSRLVGEYEPVAVVRETGDEPLVEVRNQVVVGTQIEVMHRGIRVDKVKIVSIEDPDKGVINKANPGNLVYLGTAPQLTGVEMNTILRRKIEK